MKRARTWKLRDIMSTDLITVPPDMTLRDAAALLAEEHISGAPVVEGRRVIGVVSSTDLLEFASEGGPRLEDAEPNTPWGLDEPKGEATDEAHGERDAAPPEFFVDYWVGAADDVWERVVEGGQERQRLLDGYRVADVMTRTIHALPPDTDLATAADYMLAHNIHRVLVIEEGRLLGVVTTTDMVRAMGGR